MVEMFCHAIKLPFSGENAAKMCFKTFLLRGIQFSSVDNPIPHGEYVLKLLKQFFPGENDRKHCFCFIFRRRAAVLSLRKITDPVETQERLIFIPFFWLIRRKHIFQKRPKRKLRVLSIVGKIYCGEGI